MPNKNIIIGILSIIVVIGGIYIYELSNRTVVIDDVEILEQPFNLSAKTATTAPPYVAPEPDEPAENTTQTGMIDEHLTIDPTLREVNFCGNTYNVKQVMIDGVDVVQRIAEIAENNVKVESFPQYIGTERICRDIQKTYKVGSEIIITRTGSGKIEGGQSVYYINIENLSFIINLNTNYLFEEMSGPEYPDPGAFGVFVPLTTFK